jgi:hypothetical protein
MSGEVHHRNPAARNPLNAFQTRVVWTIVFSIAFGYVEASVVVYLRGLYYPDGFGFPLRMPDQEHLFIELLREGATIVMMAAFGIALGRRSWERFGYFLVMFGVWDILYYVWLKMLLDWPSSVFDWDVLFLIPLPWIGPVLAPVLISVLMMTTGYLVIRRIDRGQPFQPPSLSWGLSVAATLVILYSFMSDVPATLGSAMPQPYKYWLLGVGLLLYLLAFLGACRGANPHG